MQFIKDLFNGHKKKSEEIHAIRTAPDAATLARVLVAADTRDRKHAFISRPFGITRGRDDTGLIPPHLANLRKEAHARATTLGLHATGLANADVTLANMSSQLSSTINDISLDLASNNAAFSYIASCSIDECHSAIKGFITTLRGFPPEAFVHAPALKKMSNPHSDSTISEDRFWDVLDFANYFSRSAISDKFSEMRGTIDDARARLHAAAIQHVATEDPQNMAIVNARIVRTPDDARRPRDPFRG